VEEAAMSIDPNLPLNLYKANLQLWLNTGKLLQQGQQRWIDLGNKSMTESIEEARGEAERMLDAEDWQGLTALAADMALRTMQKETGNVQALAETMITNQATFAAGLRDALTAWQKASANALNLAGNAPPLQASPQDFLQWLGSLVPASANSKTTRPTKKGGSHAG
jgi:hypothetical protein